MKFQKVFITLAFITLLGVSAGAQTTAFTYQGKLSDLGTAANGQYQITFKLYDAANDGGQIGSTIADVNVTVTQGIFTTQLDFGSAAFESGADRYIEISVRRNSGESYVTLLPRQAVTSTPYAVKALLADTAATAENSTQLGGINANEYVQTNDPALTDARDPLPGSANYVQNTTSAQPASNFNISGEGKAGTFSASSHFSIGSARILSNPGTFNLFVGAGAGGVNTGGYNTFVGADAGRDNTAGTENTFVGRGAGASNNIGIRNSFFGRSAGLNNTTGNANSFFGRETGFSNTTGSLNTFIGEVAGYANTVGSDNVFVGLLAGRMNVEGNSNTFVGKDSGYSNTASNNSFFGRASGAYNTTGDVNSFFGFQSGYSNTTGKWNAFFGGQAGIFNTTGQFNSFFGTFAGLSNTEGNHNAFFGLDAGRNNTTGHYNSFFGTLAGRDNTEGQHNAYFGISAGRLNTTGSWNAMFGSDAGYNNTANANSFFGNAAGNVTTTGANNAFFGADAGRFNQTGGGNAFLGTFAGLNSVSGEGNTFVGVSSGLANFSGSKNSLLGSGSNVGAGDLSFATAIGADAVVLTSNTIVLGRSGGQDKVRVPGLGEGGSTQLCLNASNEISNCSSSLRYKTNINSFGLGLDVVNRLKPITFDWKDNGLTDLGLGAEEVAAVNENLVIRNAEGRVEGVKYDRIGVVLINVVKEQQTQIEELKKQIADLKKLVLEKSEGGQK